MAAAWFPGPAQVAEARPGKSRHLRHHRVSAGSRGLDKLVSWPYVLRFRNLAHPHDVAVRTARAPGLASARMSSPRCC